MFNKFVLVIVAGFFLASCSGGIAPSAPTAKGSQAVVSLSLPDGVTLSSSGVFSSSSESVFTASSATVTSIDLAVTATGMTTITSSIPLTSPHTVTLNISAGASRTFAITVTTSNGETFTGSKTADLTAGSSLSISITINAINITITGTASDTTTTASSSAFGASAVTGSAGNLAGATVKAIKLDGTVVATTTTDANGAYTLDVPKDTNYIIRITKGNVVMKTLFVSSSSNATADVNPYSSAIVRALADSIGNSNLGEEGTDVSGDIDVVTLATTITNIKGNSSFATLVANIRDDIKNHADYTLPAGTTPTTGGASIRITLQIIVTITKLAGSTLADTTAPTISSKSPASGATGIATNSSVSVTFSEAIKLFSKVLELDDDDGPALTYLERSLDFNLSPPDKNWNGVHVLTSK